MCDVLSNPSESSYCIRFPSLVTRDTIPVTESDYPPPALLPAIAIADVEALMQLGISFLKTPPHGQWC